MPKQENIIRVLFVGMRDLRARLEPVLKTYACDIMVADTHNDLDAQAYACDIAVLKTDSGSIENDEAFAALRDDCEGCGFIIISENQSPAPELPPGVHAVASPTADANLLGALIVQAGLHSRAQRELDTSRLMAELGRTTSHIVHDLNNILAVVIGNAELARSELSSGLPALEEIIEILNEAKRGREFVSGLRHFSPKKKSFPSRVAATDLLDDFIAFFSGDLPENIRLDALIDCDAELNADTSQIKTALDNICRNAVESMSGGGVLGMACARRRRRCIITISDTGGGMAADILENAAKPLFTTKRDHFGLGLSVARYIAECHNGTLSITSQPEKGTTVNISLPVAGNL